MTRLFLAFIALLAFGGISQAQPTSWDRSYVAGGMAGNQFLGGTEIRELIPWNPGKPDAKLYAGNSYWEDTPGPEGKQNAQVLVLTSSHGFWQQDVNFGIFCPPVAPKCALAVGTLEKLSPFRRIRMALPLVSKFWLPVPGIFAQAQNRLMCMRKTIPMGYGLKLRLV